MINFITLISMDSNFSTIAGITGIITVIGVIGKILYKLNHTRIRSRCCDTKLDMSLDIDISQPSPTQPVEPKEPTG